MVAVSALSRNMLFAVGLTVPRPSPYGTTGRNQGPGKEEPEELLDMTPLPLKQIFLSACSAICPVSHFTGGLGS